MYGSCNVQYSWGRSASTLSFLFLTAFVYGSCNVQYSWGRSASTLSFLFLTAFVYGSCNVQYSWGRSASTLSFLFLTAFVYGSCNVQYSWGRSVSTCRWTGHVLDCFFSVLVFRRVCTVCTRVSAYIKCCADSERNFYTYTSAVHASQKEV